jgi:hypothetical protein
MILLFRIQVDLLDLFYLIMLKYGEPVPSFLPPVFLMTLIDSDLIDPVFEAPDIFEAIQMVIDRNECPLGHFHGYIMVPEISQGKVIDPFKPQPDEFSKCMIIALLGFFYQAFAVIDGNVP